MKFEFIKQNTVEYQQAVKIRIDQFFKDMQNAESLINDKFESKGIHLVCINGYDDVIGTGRLHFDGKIGVISQMAIDTNYQKQGVGRKILEKLIDRCHEENTERIELAARKTALGFYLKFGFEPVGEFYPSKKTGIIHIKMVKNVGK